MKDLSLASLIGMLESCYLWRKKSGENFARMSITSLLLVLCAHSKDKTELIRHLTHLLNGETFKYGKCEYWVTC